MPFPDIDPIIFSIGPLSIRWYSMAYLVGILWGAHIVKKRGKSFLNIDEKISDDYIIWATLGIILGGRIGYVLFYNFEYYIVNPSQILAVWHGGMSFHGGLCGLIIATFIYLRKHKIAFFPFADILCTVGPLGLFFGRCANFINGELFGRVAPDLSWGIIFPTGGPLPRHPSQIYEALLEGALLFIITNIAWAKMKNKTGFTSGVFLCGYSFCRMFVEQFREPDVQVGFVFSHITMGQILSTPMLIIGIILVANSLRLKHANS